MQTLLRGVGTGKHGSVTVLISLDSAIMVEAATVKILSLYFSSSRSVNITIDCSLGALIA